MAINTIHNTVRTLMCDAFVDAHDVGTTNTGARILIYDAAVLLATCEFENPAYDAATNGVAVRAGSISDDTSADNDGTADIFEVTDRDNLVIYKGTVTATSGGGDIELSSTGITTGDRVSITNSTITMPAS